MTSTRPHAFRSSTLLAGALALASIASAQPAPFRVGDLTARPGERVSGMLPVPRGADADVSLPVTIVHGSRPGPVVGLIAGNHGYEYPPILALQRLRERIDPARLRGTLVLVHVANPPSFFGRTVYTSPIDGKNLNRMYPGDPDGTVSQRIAWTITREVIERSDYVLDVHGGDGNESLRPFVYMPVTGKPDLDRAIRDLALAFGLDHIVVDRDRVDDPEASLYCDRTATSRGKPALTVESGYLGGRDEASVALLVNGIAGVLRHLDLIDHSDLMGGETSVVEHPIFLETTQVLTSPETGVLTPLVERGQTVAAGTPLARISDLFGEPLAVVRAPFAGEVLYVVGTPPISEGEPVAMVGSTERRRARPGS